MMNWVLILGVLASLVAGCATNRIVARDLSHPVSASGSLFDANLNVCRVDHGLERVGAVELVETQWTLLWGFIHGDEERDISRQLEASIRASDADGIVNLKVSNVSPPTNFLGVVAPIFPFISRARIEGDLVKHGEGCLAEYIDPPSSPQG